MKDCFFLFVAVALIFLSALMAFNELEFNYCDDDTLLHQYNGSFVDLPEEIDCATVGDTLIVYRTETIVKGQSRKIYVGFKN